MYISETFFKDQAALRVDVTTKDCAGELGYKGKNMYVCMLHVWEIVLKSVDAYLWKYKKISA